MANACTANTQVTVEAGYYATLQAAYNVALDGATIQALVIDFAEDLITSATKPVTIDGGHLCGFSSNRDMTIIFELPQITNDIVTMKNVHIK